jgi:hypothetical protein
LGDNIEADTNRSQHLSLLSTPFEEIDWKSGSDEIDDCEYLYILGVEGIKELTLRIEIHEAKAGSPLDTSDDDSPLARLRNGGRPIQVDRSCRKFQVVFERDSMISYSILNESYGKYPEAPEEFSGKLLRVFAWSQLLEFTKRTTYAGNELTGPLQHYQIASLNHVLDVICTRPPRIWMRKPPVRTFWAN